MNPKEQKLCDQLYQKHSDAIQTIVRAKLSQEIETSLLKSLLRLENRNSGSFVINSQKPNQKYIWGSLLDEEDEPTYFWIENGGGDRGIKFKICFDMKYGGKKQWLKFRRLLEKYPVFNRVSDAKNPTLYDRMLLPDGCLLNESKRIELIVSNWMELLDTDMPKIRRAIKAMMRAK